MKVEKQKKKNMKSLVTKTFTKQIVFSKGLKSHSKPEVTSRDKGKESL